MWAAKLEKKTFETAEHEKNFIGAEHEKTLLGPPSLKIFLGRIKVFVKAVESDLVPFIHSFAFCQ